MKARIGIYSLGFILVFASCKSNKKDDKTVKQDSVSIQNPTDTIHAKSSPVVADKSFTKTLTWDELKFEVELKNNIIVIQPQGLTGDNSKIEKNIEGTITDAQIEDLDGDGFPEILIYVSTADEHQYGTVIGYSVNEKKSLTPISFTDIRAGAGTGKGYQGHDKFYAGDGQLIRSYPVYEEDKATGSTKQLYYTLSKVQGDKVFKLSKKNQ